MRETFKLRLLFFVDFFPGFRSREEKSYKLLHDPSFFVRFLRGKDISIYSFFEHSFKFRLGSPWNSLSMLMIKGPGTKVSLSPTVQTLERSRSILAGSEKNPPAQSLLEDSSEKSNHPRVFQGTCEDEKCLEKKCPSTCPTHWENKAHFTHGKISSSILGKDTWKGYKYVSTLDPKKEIKPQFMVYYYYDKARSVEREDIVVDHLMTGYAQKNQDTITDSWDQDPSKGK